MCDDLIKQLDEVKRFRAMIKRKHYKKSKLDKFQRDILRLQKNKASLGDIQVWLRDRRITVERSTILRRIRFWKNSNAKI